MALPCKNLKIMKKCSKNSGFFTIRISEFGASIFGRSNGPNISGFRIIRISGLQHWFWCVLSGYENEKIMFHKSPIWNLFDLHECFSYVLSDYQLEWFSTIFTFEIFMIFMNFFDMNPKRSSPSKWFFTWATFVIFVTFMNGFDITSQVLWMVFTYM